MNRHSACGFTLIEVMITTVVLVVALVSTMALISRSIAVPNEIRSSMMAMNEVKRRMEIIRDATYAENRTALTNNGAWREIGVAATGIAGLVGSSTSYAQELPGAADGLMRIKVVICYRQGNRIIGEDLNLNGTLEIATEDENGNGELDSPCQLETVEVNKDI